MPNTGKGGKGASGRQPARNPQARSSRSLMSILEQAGFRGQALQQAYAIAMAESGGRARAYNGNAKTGDKSYGLFQINMLGDMGPARLKQYGLSSNDDLFDPLTNAKVAFKMSHGGENWQPWSTYKSGAYTRFMGQSGAQVTGGGGGAVATDKTASVDQPLTAGDYGYVDAFLDRHPDVRKVLNQAIAGGWSTQKTQAEIKGTDWWRTRTDAQRQWDILSTENPEEANRRIHEKAGEIRQQAAAMGVRLESGDAWKYAKQFLTNGSTQQEQAYALAAEFNMPGAGKGMTGTAQDVEATLKGMSAAYGVTMTRAQEQEYIQNVLAGKQTAEQYQDTFREQAKVLYPTIKGYLDGGGTVKQYMDPYLSIASNELGIPTMGMSALDPKWTRMLTGNNGQPMDAHMWTATIRSDPVYKWDQSQGAKDIATKFVSDMRSAMGG